LRDFTGHRFSCHTFFVADDEEIGMSDTDLAALRPLLVRAVAARVPSSDVEDVVQAALADAVASKKKPSAPDERRAWIFGIARHKIADYHRSRRRESPQGDGDADLPDSAPHHSERDLLRWAEQVLPEGEDAKKTLEWMLREGDGEKLEAIAEGARVPAPTVRKRVSRLREHFRAQWKKELALVAAAALIATMWFLLARQPKEEAHHVPKPSVTALPPSEVAEGLRIEGVDACRREEYVECIEKLDRAKALDPAGDTREDVVRARAAADAARRAPPPAPSALPSAVPTSVVPMPSAIPTSSAAPRIPTSSAPPSRPVPTSAPTPAPRTFTGTGGSSL
jgi:RNA polymerase sigma factor (sigma-70 family)